MITKELFPAIQRKESTSSNKSFRRHPVKLPLRKHHSFHFQPSSQIGGGSGIGGTSTLRMRHQYDKNQSDDRLSTASSSGNLNAKNQLSLGGGGGGEEIINSLYKPYDENSAFQPIQPISQAFNKSMPNTNLLDSECNNTMSQSSNNNSNDAKSYSSSSSGSDKIHNINNMPKTNALSVDRRTQEPFGGNSATLTAKRLVYADLLDTSKGTSSDTDARKVNCIPKPSRTQYATIQFPEVNI